MFLIKKWGILIKKESESFIFTDLKIPRDYDLQKEDADISQSREYLVDGDENDIAPEIMQVDTKS